MGVFPVCFIVFNRKEKTYVFNTKNGELNHSDSPVICSGKKKI